VAAKLRRKPPGVGVASLAWPEPGTLRSGRVGIRLVRPRDAHRLEDLLLEHRSWLEEWEATYPGYRRASIQRFQLKPVIRSLLASYRARTGVPFVILFDDDVVGQVSVSGVLGGSVLSAQLGYWISEDFAGRGITPIAVALAVDYCLQQIRLHRVEICIRPENTASLRVVEKLGFRYEGLRKKYIHINNEWCDHKCFALTAEDIPQGLLRTYLAS